MTNEEAANLLQTLRGSAATVLWAYRMAGRPISNRELQRWTGYSDKIVTAATRRLVEAGCVTALGGRGPWTIAPAFAGSDLGGPGSDSIGDSDLSSSRSSSSTSTRSSSSTNSESSSRSRYRTRTGARSGLRLITGPDSPTSQGFEAETRPTQPEPDPTWPQTPTQPEVTPIQPEYANVWDRAANLRVLKELGINEPAASRLAERKHVTPAYIRAQVAEVRALGEKPGMAIYRMERGWPVPHRSSASVHETAGTASHSSSASIPPRRFDLRSAPLGVRPAGYELADLEARAREQRQKSQPAPAPDEEGRRIEANVQALLEWGGAEQVASRLARLPHVTPELVRAHYRQAFENGQDVLTALYRIETNEPLPEQWIHGTCEPGEVEAGVRRLAEKLKVGGGGRMYGGRPK